MILLQALKVRSTILINTSCKNYRTFGEHFDTIHKTAISRTQTWVNRQRCFKSREELVRKKWFLHQMHNGHCYIKELTEYFFVTVVRMFSILGYVKEVITQPFNVKKANQRRGDVRKTKIERPKQFYIILSDQMYIKEDIFNTRTCFLLQKTAKHDPAEKVIFKYISNRAEFSQCDNFD